MAVAVAGRGGALGEEIDFPSRLSRSVCHAVGPAAWRDAALGGFWDLILRRRAVRVCSIMRWFFVMLVCWCVGVLHCILLMDR